MSDQVTGAATPNHVIRAINDMLFGPGPMPMEGTNPMSDTQTAPTLRELLDQHDMHISPADRVCIPKSDVDRVQADLLAPLQMKVEHLSTQIEQDNAVINTLMADASVYVSEINALRAQVAAADEQLLAAKNLWSAAVGVGFILESYHPETQSLETVKDLRELAKDFYDIAYDTTKTEGTAAPVERIDAHLENVKRMSFSKRKKFWDELQQRAHKGREGWVVSWPDVLLLVRPEDWEAAILSVASDEQALRRNIDAVRTAFGAKAEDTPPAVAPVGEDAVALLVDATRALIYERDMAGCWRKDQADAELRNVEDVLDSHFGGSYPPPDEDEDDDTPPVPPAASTRAGISEEVNHEHARGVRPNGAGAVSSGVRGVHDPDTARNGGQDSQPGMAGVGVGCRCGNVDRGDGDSRNDVTDTTPAVVDAEPGEDDVFDFTTTGTLEDDRKEMQANNSSTGVLYRLAYMEARDDINREEVTALRRDVDAVSLEVRDATCTIVDTRDNMIYELKERIERLESRERPETDRIEVTDAMIDAFWASWGSGTLDALTRGPLRDALSSALAAREADQ